MKRRIRKKKLKASLSCSNSINASIKWMIIYYYYFNIFIAHSNFFFAFWMWIAEMACIESIYRLLTCTIKLHRQSKQTKARKQIILLMKAFVNKINWLNDSSRKREWNLNHVSQPSEWNQWNYRFFFAFINQTMPLFLFKYSIQFEMCAFCRWNCNCIVFGWFLVVPHPPKYGHQSFSSKNRIELNETWKHISKKQKRIKSNYIAPKIVEWQQWQL